MIMNFEELVTKKFLVLLFRPPIDRKKSIVTSKPLKQAFKSVKCEKITNPIWLTSNARQGKKNSAMIHILKL